MEKIIAVLVLCCVGFIDGGKDVKGLVPLEDIAADIEMAVVAEQIALNAICLHVEKNHQNIRALHEELKYLKLEKVHEPTLSGSVLLVKSNVFPETDSDGNRHKRVTVAFEHPYASVPKVHASFQRLEIPDSSHYSVEVVVEDVTKDDFTIRASTKGNDTVVNLAIASWISVPAHL